MPANIAKYRLSIADIPSENFEVIDFSGCDAIGALYWFVIHFRMSKVSALAPPSAAILGETCRFDFVQNGVLIPYCGVVTQFGVSDSDDTCYTIRLEPRMHSLTLNSTTRAFQNLTVLEAIESVATEAGLSEHIRFEVEPDDIKYPKREFCVQHRETHLAFISRLMEAYGLWYRFEQATHSDGTLIERAIVSDEFFRFPSLGRSIPFMKGKGLAEITSAGSAVESVNDISASSKLMPQSVRVRTYNHRTPESAPDAISDVTDGHEGRIYEYGGTARNSSEAERHAELHARRLWVEHSLGEGKSNCASFHAGQCVSIRHKDNDSLEGTYLLVSVKHFGGWDGGAYTYRNEFTCVRAEQEIYALPLRTPVPHIPGVITARIGATGDGIPTLNEYGNYKANMLFELGDGQGDTDQNGSDYNGSKHIRRIQFSGGVLDDGSYGSHFTSKRGAEVVL
ncbi:MAG: hypothetical protein LBH93_08875, partial [Chitinispirillales bacterium]|nr:hypothetical protein [Chitinispirillales bacterium]